MTPIPGRSTLQLPIGECDASPLTSGQVRFPLRGKGRGVSDTTRGEGTLRPAGRSHAMPGTFTGPATRQGLAGLLFWCWVTNPRMDRDSK